MKLVREQAQQQIQYIGKYGTFQLCVKMATSIVTRGLCVIEARDVKIELVLWSEQSSDSEGEVGIEIIVFG